MNFNPQVMQMVAAIKNGNPQQMVMNMLEQSAQGNPILTSLLSMAKDGNTGEIEALARNIARERGFDFDNEFNSFRQMFGL